MDYSRLSRESLIHEIEQLNLENERIKLKNIGNQLGIHECLDDIQSPAFIVNPEFKVIWANANSSLNYKEVLDKKCYQAFFGYEDVCPGCLMQKCVISMQYNEMISQFPILDVVKNISIQFIPLVRDGKFQGVLEMHHEIEGLNQLQYENSEKLKALNSELEIITNRHEKLTNLVQQISKAMRVPLRSFIGYFQVFSESENEELKSEYLSVLKMNSEVLYETFSKLILFSRFESGVVSGKKEPFSVKKLFEASIEQAILPNRQIEKSNYTLNYTETLPDVLVGDAFSLKLLISYLLEFVQHVSNRELVEIKVSDITQTHSKMVLKLSIRSSYHFENKSKLLEYFDVNLNTEFESIEEYSRGLGLYLAQKMILAQNGTLDMSTGLDDVFYIDVTLSYNKVIPRGDDEKVEKRQLKKRLLVADFEKPKLSLEIFKNYDIYFAHTGDDAIKQYFKIEPDLTILNVLIENCDGFKVFDEIERRRKKITPIVAISNKLVDNEREFLRDYGFNEYYPKPLCDEKLQDILDNYF